MIEWNYIVIGLSFLLLVFLLFKEIKRQNKARLSLRIVASLFAVICLACIALPVRYHKVKTIDAANEAILLTDGFDRDSLEHFLRSKEKVLPVFTLDEKMVSAKKYKASLVTDQDFFTEDINKVHVFGYGLEKGELESLNKKEIVFHPSKIKTGITSINWQPKIKSGEKLFVQGRFNNAFSSKKIVLTGFGIALDSAIIPANKNHNFELTTIPKHTGRTVYSLSVIDKKDTIQKEPVPVQVEQGESLKILILASSPDFENKFLKNWLAQKGYEVAVRTAISKNKFDKDYVNTPIINLNRITSSLLDKFDIIIADAAELASISRQELATLQSYIIQKSKGLIIKTETASSRSAFYTNRFPLATGNLNGQPITVNLIDSSFKLSPLVMESPVVIRNQNGTLPLVSDKQNRVFVSSSLYGTGKMVISTLPNTFSWALSGKQVDYGNFWSELLNNAAGKKIEEESWGTSPFLPRINKPITILLRTNNNGLPQGQVDGTTVYLKNNHNLPFEWSGSFWPSKEGWQTGIQMNGDTYYWYAYGNNDWKTVEAFDKLQMKEQYAVGNLYKAASGEKPITSQKTEFPKIIELTKFAPFAIASAFADNNKSTFSFTGTSNVFFSMGAFQLTSP
jgi:hypothetical protein